MERLLHIAAILSILLAIPLSPARAGDTGCSSTGGEPLDLTLDGVRLQGCLPFAPQGEWVLPGADEMYPVAYTAGTGAGVTVEAIPFGMQLPSEVFPRIETTTSEASLRETLRQARVTQGARTQTGPSAQLFGQTVESLVSTLYLPAMATRAQLTRLTEWLVIAGERLWVVRASQPLPLLGIAPVTGMQVTGQNLDAPSPSAAIYQREVKLAAERAKNAVKPASSDPYMLPSPAWWHDAPCDSQHYPGSYGLGPSYRNVKTCGPLPGASWGVPVYFYPNAFPALEWQCVELVLRFMYQAYGVPPYPANGNGIVPNYQGNRLKVVYNDGKSGAPVPGDVLSYGVEYTYGHTSVVTASDVDSSGNGSITVMEQNWTPGGQSRLTVSKWYVYGGSAGRVYGWLHAAENPFPTSTPTPTPTPTCIPLSSNWPTATPGPTGTPAPYAGYIPALYSNGCS